MPAKTKKKIRKKSIKNNKKTTNNNFINFLRDQNGTVKKIYVILFIFVFVSCSIIIISYMSRGYLDNYVKENIVEKEKSVAHNQELSQIDITSREGCLNENYGWCNNLNTCLVKGGHVCGDGEEVEKWDTVKYDK